MLPNTKLNVKSILYITPANEEIAIEAFRVLEQQNANPARAYFLCEPYKLTFSKAFKLDNDSLSMADLQIESEKQAQYAANFQQAKALFVEEQEKYKNSIQEREQKFKIKLGANVRRNYTKDINNYQDEPSNSLYKKAAKNERMEMLKRVYNSNN